MAIIELEGKIDGHDVFDAIVDSIPEYDEEWELKLGAAIKGVSFNFDFRIDEGDALEHISDEAIEEAFKSISAADFAQIESPRDFISAIGYLSDGDKHMARTMFSRAFQGYDILIRQIDETLR